MKVLIKCGDGTNDVSVNEIDCYESICAVYVDSVQFIECTSASAEIFKNSYYKQNDALNIVSSAGTIENPGVVTIFYYKMPELKKIENDKVTGNVMVPIEFLELVKAKLKATMYRNANEDELCAKWTALYNVKLEQFKIWVEQKRPKFGLN